MRLTLRWFIGWCFIRGNRPHYFTEVVLAVTRQIYEECLHVDSYSCMVEAVGLDPEEIYGLYRKDKDLFYKNKRVLESMYKINRADFSTKTVEGVREFVEACTTNLIFEGIFFSVHS